MILKPHLGALGVGLVALSLFAGSSTSASRAASPIREVLTISTQNLPAPDTYTIDRLHTFASFGARHHVVGLVRGRFDKVEGTFTAAKDPAACTLDVSIDAASISTQVAERDADLRSPAYFDVKKFPTLTYQGRGIRPGPQHTWIMEGVLTIHGVSKTVPLTFTYNGIMTPVVSGAPTRVALHAAAAIKRADFGLGARDNLDELGTLSSPDVQIEIDVEADSKILAR
jgi:polyisoprenoid-binding protein YceI